MNISIFKKLSIVGACAIILSACGGGSGGGSESSSRPSYNNINLSSSNVTAEITESNYEDAVTGASAAIYSMLTGTHEMQHIVIPFFSILKNGYENDDSRDWSSFSIGVDKNPAECTDGTSSAALLNFSKTGEVQPGSQVTMNMSNCHIDDGSLDGSLTFTANDPQTATYTSDYVFFFKDNSETVKLDGGEISKWEGTLQKTQYGFNGNYKNSSENIAFTLKGSAEFDATMVNDNARPVALLLKDDNFIDIKGIGSLQFYTKTKLDFKNGKVNSGTIVAKGKNAATGKIEMVITDGKVTVKLNGTQVGEVHDNAHEYLGFE